MPCSGDSSQFCGAGWRIQVSYAFRPLSHFNLTPGVKIYKSPALPPGSWTLRGCAVDTPSTPAFTNNVYVTPANNVDLPGQCNEICRKRGFPFSGPIAGSTCECGTAQSPNIQFVDASECNSLCPEPPGIPGQVFCGGPSRIMVSSGLIKISSWTLTEIRTRFMPTRPNFAMRTWSLLNIRLPKHGPKFHFLIRYMLLRL